MRMHCRHHVYVSFRDFPSVDHDTPILATAQQKKINPTTRSLCRSATNGSLEPVRKVLLNRREYCPSYLRFCFRWPRQSGDGTEDTVQSRPQMEMKSTSAAYSRCRQQNTKVNINQTRDSMVDCHTIKTMLTENVDAIVASLTSHVNTRGSSEGSS